MAPVKKVVRWKTRHAFKMAPRHHTFPQKLEAQPVWIDILVSHRRWQTSKIGSRMEVEWRTVTWFCSSPSHSEGVENKSLSLWRSVVVDYLNNSKYTFQLGLADLSITLLWCEILDLCCQKCEICDLVYSTSLMMFSVKSHYVWSLSHICHYMTFNHVCKKTWDLTVYDI